MAACCTTIFARRRAMNINQIVTDRFSNPASLAVYREQWPAAPELRKQYLEGKQCGGCSYFAPFNTDFGLCCHLRSEHHLETVGEHFTCAAFVSEGWGPHSFCDDADYHCRCGGEELPDFAAS